MPQISSFSGPRSHFFTFFGDNVKMSIQSPACLCSTVTKLVCGDQSAVSSPRASCPARQRRPLLSQRKGGGDLRLHAGRGRRTLLRLPPSTFPQPPFKGVPQEPLCQQAAKYINIRTPFLTHRPTSMSQSHAYSHVCVRTCLAISS